jgi:hypothetical protein
VTVAAGRKLVGVWALFERGVGPIRVATRLGRALQTYDDLMTDTNEDRGAVARAAWAALVGRGGLDLVSLPCIESGAPLLSVGEVALAARPAGTALSVDLRRWTTPAAWDASLSASRRKSLRRARDRLAAMGRVVVEGIDGAAARRAAVTEALALKTA